MPFLTISPVLGSLTHLGITDVGGRAKKDVKQFEGISVKIFLSFLLLPMSREKNENFVFFLKKCQSFLASKKVWKDNGKKVQPFFRGQDWTVGMEWCAALIKMFCLGRGLHQMIDNWSNVFQIILQTISLPYWSKVSFCLSWKIQWFTILGFQRMVIWGVQEPLMQYLHLLSVKLQCTN